MCRLLVDNFKQGVEGGGEIFLGEGGGKGDMSECNTVIFKKFSAEGGGGIKFFPRRVPPHWSTPLAVGLSSIL